MIKLQTVLEEGVVVSVERDAVLSGAMATPTCKLRIDDSSDGEHVGLIATLTTDETEALGQAMVRYAEQLRKQAIRNTSGNYVTRLLERIAKPGWPPEQTPTDLPEGGELQSMTVEETPEDG